MDDSCKHERLGLKLNGHLQVDGHRPKWTMGRIIRLELDDSSKLLIIFRSWKSCRVHPSFSYRNTSNFPKLRNHAFHKLFSWRLQWAFYACLQTILPPSNELADCPPLAHISALFCHAILHADPEGHLFSIDSDVSLCKPLNIQVFLK